MKNPLKIYFFNPDTYLLSYSQTGDGHAVAPLNPAPHGSPVPEVTKGNCKIFGTGTGGAYSVINPWFWLYVVLSIF